MSISSFLSKLFEITLSTPLDNEPQSYTTLKLLFSVLMIRYKIPLALQGKKFFAFLSS